MKIEKIIYIFFITIILVLAWKAYNVLNPNYEKKFKENISELEDNRTELAKMVDLATLEISTENIANNAMDLDDVSPNLREVMEDLGIRSFRFELIDTCKKKYRFFFNVSEGWNINTLNNVELIYSPCDVETQKGFHSFDGGHIDVLGADGDWKILSDTDFI